MHRQPGELVGKREDQLLLPLEITSDGGDQLVIQGCKWLLDLQERWFLPIHDRRDRYTRAQTLLAATEGPSQRADKRVDQVRLNADLVAGNLSRAVHKCVHGGFRLHILDNRRIRRKLVQLSQ